jgi:hypothetical protein
VNSFKFQKIQTQNQELNRIQDNIQNLANQLFAGQTPQPTGPFIGGSILSGLSVLAASAVAFNHGLGRVPQVWTITDQGASAVVWRTAWDATTITLQSSADCTINIWVN